MRARLRAVGRDIGPALRSLRGAPWYTATVIAAVALALALATTVFAIVDGVLFKRPPYADPDRLVGIELGFYREGVLGGRISPEDLDAWQAAIPDVPLAAVRVDDTTGLERVNEPGLGLAHIRPNLLEVLGVRPLVGGFSQDDLDLLRAERPPIRPVLITFELWQSRFGGTSEAIGRVVEPENPTYTPIRIAGVLPAGFVVPAGRGAQLVMPSPERHASSLRDTTVLARLPEGLPVEAFRVRLEAAMQGATSSRGDEGRGRRPDRAVIRPLDDALDGWLGPVFRGLFAAVGVLALIACLNVSGLMTARCVDRARDIALRRAIGARAADVIRLLLVEHGLLFAAGAGLGLAASGPLLRFVTGILPTDLHLLKSPAIDFRVIVFATLAMITSLLLASVWPVRRALRSGLQQVITAGGAVTQRTASFASRSMTMGQVAGAVVLVVAGGLLVGSLLRVHANEMGYDADRVVIAELGVAMWLDDEALRGDWGALRLRTGERLASFLDDLRDLPDVESAGAADVDVLVGSLTFTSRFDPIGRDVSAEHGLGPGSLMVGASGGLHIPVTPGFFEAAGVKVIAGRVPTDEELRRGAPVVAVSRSFARQHFDGQRAVGQFVVHKPARPNLPPFEIVGIVEDQRIATWDAPAMSTVFTPYARFGGAIDPVVFVRGNRGGRPLADAVLRFAEAARPTLRPVRVQTAAAMLGDSIRARRLQSWLFGAFAVSGLLLAGVGLFGFVAMTMARRTREVGIRMALGATRDRLVAGLVREQLTPVLLGLVSGVVLAALLVRFLESYLYELSIYDARVWGAAMALVVATTVTGALIPSWRASQVDPISALRVD